MNDFQKAEIVSTFVKATMNTFWDLSGYELVPQKPIVRDGTGYNHDYSGIIRMTGNQSGAIHINFPVNTVKAIITTSMSPNSEAVTNIEEHQDINNLLQTIWKEASTDITYQSTFLIPRIIKKPHFVLDESDAYLSLVVPFSSIYGPFDLTFCLQKSKSSRESSTQVPT